MKSYKLHSTLVPEFIEGPAAMTPNQVAAMIDQNLGGWPVTAHYLVGFPHKLSEWVIGDGPPRHCTFEEYEERRRNLKANYRFTDERFCSLDGKRDYSEELKTGWHKTLSRDEYYLLRLSPGALKSIEQRLRAEIVADLRARIV